MRALLWIRLVFVGLLLVTPRVGAAVRATGDPVNAVTGDRSWTDSYGSTPRAWSSEALRIQTHLTWVARLLRARDVPALAPAPRRERAALLAVLDAYAARGVFPRHDPSTTAAPGRRRPRFVDRAGRRCAVAQLIEASGRADLVASLQRAHEYDRVLDMGEPALAAWADAHGFTPTELAAIQPSYDDGGSVEMPDEFRHRWRRRPPPQALPQEVLDRAIATLASPAVQRVCLGAREGHWTLRAQLSVTATSRLTPAVTVSLSPAATAVSRCLTGALLRALREHFTAHRYEWRGTRTARAVLAIDTPRRTPAPVAPRPVLPLD